MLMIIYNDIHTATDGDPKMTSTALSIEQHTHTIIATANTNNHEHKQDENELDAREFTRTRPRDDQTPVHTEKCVEPDNRNAATLIASFFSQYLASRRKKCCSTNEIPAAPLFFSFFCQEVDGKKCD